jgi:hypothetical protein
VSSTSDDRVHGAILDQQNAFDTVDHIIMHMKLQASGIGNDIFT